jgi:hypothetical protein
LSCDHPPEQGPLLPGSSAKAPLVNAKAGGAQHRHLLAELALGGEFPLEL